jgi:hypothetical protein
MGGAIGRNSERLRQSLSGEPNRWPFAFVVGAGKDGLGVFIDAVITGGERRKQDNLAIALVLPVLDKGSSTLTDVPDFAMVPARPSDFVLATDGDGSCVEPRRSEIWPARTFWRAFYLEDKTVGGRLRRMFRLSAAAKFS